jgi:hypothetical protein
MLDTRAILVYGPHMGMRCALCGTPEGELQSVYVDPRNVPQYSVKRATHVCVCRACSRAIVAAWAKSERVIKPKVKHYGSR